MNQGLVVISPILLVRLLTVEEFGRYREFLNQRAVPDYRSVPGNISVHILERADGAVTHFVTSGRLQMYSLSTSRRRA